MEDLYGQRLAGVFGYGHLLGEFLLAYVCGVYLICVVVVGGYSGLQAEYARIPLGT